MRDPIPAWQSFEVIIFLGSSEVRAPRWASAVDEGNAISLCDQRHTLPGGQMPFTLRYQSDAQSMGHHLDQKVQFDGQWTE
jgi:hypothetical protein